MKSILAKIVFVNNMEVVIIFPLLVCGFHALGNLSHLLRSLAKRLLNWHCITSIKESLYFHKEIFLFELRNVFLRGETFR
jgi:hypothetical protein